MKNKQVLKFFTKKDMKHLDSWFFKFVNFYEDHGLPSSDLGSKLSLFAKMIELSVLKYNGLTGKEDLDKEVN